MVTATMEAERIINSLGASFWLRDALAAMLRRDPVDAVNDAETLLAILQQRLAELQDRYI